jgi:antitoxin VapB
VERTARLFTNGRSQAVRIPKPFEFPGREVVFRREGERVYIDPKPAEADSIGDLLDSWVREPIEDEEFVIEPLPAGRVDL